MDKTPSETSPKVATKRPSERTKDEPATKKPGLKFSKLPPLPKPRKFVLPPQKTKKEISIKLTSKEEKESANIKVVPKSGKAAAVFNEDSDVSLINNLQINPRLWRIQMMRHAGLGWRVRGVVWMVINQGVQTQPT
ncbi:uncharacterized protein LOC144748834 [Ciona intestinalis]